MQNVPDELGRQGRRIPYLMGRRGREDDEITNLLIMHIEWEVHSPQFVYPQIDPVNVG